MDETINSKFRIKTRIGGGSFGEIYQGEHILTHDPVAIKLESLQTKPQQLFVESKLYKTLYGAPGIPEMHWYGTQGDHNVLVMELLGKSLQKLFESCNRKFSLKTVLMLAEQMLARIEYLHSKGFIHRDIKPDNFVLGTGSRSNVVYLIDYGLVRKYRDPRTHEHIPYRDGKNLSGTARYSSIFTHLGIEQSRRDDLEGIAYVLIYFLKQLPWQGVSGSTRKEKYDNIATMKQETLIENLCQGLPQQFATFVAEVRRLDFTDQPDYSFFKSLFRDLFISLGYVYDWQYDWVKEQTPPIPRPMTTVKKETNLDHAKPRVKQSVRSPTRVLSRNYIPRNTPSVGMNKVKLPILGGRTRSRPIMIH